MPGLPVPVATPQRPHLVFAYGTLMNPERLSLVIGRRVSDTRVSLDFETVKGYRLERFTYSYVTPDPGHCVLGLVIGPFSDRELQRIDAYESVDTGLYTRKLCFVKAEGEDEPRSCWIYVGKRIDEMRRNAESLGHLSYNRVKRTAQPQLAT